jgi:hypothetical protein
MTEGPIVDDRIRRFHRHLLGELAASPPMPAEMECDTFLERIYEHAAAAEASGLGEILTAAMAPVTAPEDACWREVEEPPNIRDRVAAALPAADTPGWLWTRIRTDMRGQRAALDVCRRKSLRSAGLRYAAAAAVVIGVCFGGVFLVKQGTNEPTKFVWVKDSTLNGASDILMGRRSNS